MNQPLPKAPPIDLRKLREQYAQRRVAGTVAVSVQPQPAHARAPAHNADLPGISAAAPYDTAKEFDTPLLWRRAQIVSTGKANSGDGTGSSMRPSQTK